jgi:hypothetical protein
VLAGTGLPLILIPRILDNIHVQIPQQPPPPSDKKGGLAAGAHRIILCARERREKFSHIAKTKHAGAARKSKYAFQRVAPPL